MGPAVYGTMDFGVSAVEPPAAVQVPSHLRTKKLAVSMAVPPVPSRVPSQKSLTPSVASVMSIANDKGDNKMILGAVCRSPGVCLTAEENPRKHQLGDRLMKGLCDQSSPQMGSLSSK